MSVRLGLPSFDGSRVVLESCDSKNHQGTREGLPMPIQHKFKKPVVSVRPVIDGARLLSNKDLDLVRQDVITKEEVAAFLRVEPNTVYELTRKRGRHPL